jgi:hypothetical protein
MERHELSKLTLSELLEQARRRGLGDVEGLRREQIIDRLASAPAAAEPEPQGLLGRARQLVKRAAERARERLVAPRDTRSPSAQEGSVAPRDTRSPSAQEGSVAPRDTRSPSAQGGSRAGMGSPTPRPPLPRRDPTPARQATETETMARLYEEQGHLADALRIYRKILDERPDRADLLERIASLEPRSGKPPGPLLFGPRPGETPAPATAGAEPLSMLDDEELPDAFGIDDVMVMPRDPWHVFVYWEVTPEGRAGARTHLGAEAHVGALVLRVYSVGVADGGIVKQERDVELDGDRGRRLLPAPGAGLRVSVAVGLRGPSGAFAPIAHSPSVLVPPAEPGPEGPAEWMEVVPARRRGAAFEPIVVVTHGRERLVRGLAAPSWHAGSWHHAGTRVVPSSPHGPMPPGASRPASSWLRWPAGATPVRDPGAGNEG